MKLKVHLQIIRGEVAMELLAKFRENLDQSRVSLILVLIRCEFHSYYKFVKLQNV